MIFAVMTLLTNLAVVLVVACISQQLMVANCQKEKGKGRKGRTEGKEKVKDRGQKQGEQPPPKLPVPSPHKKDGGPKAPFKGKFTAKDKTQCTWVATGDDAFVLGVNCNKGGQRFECEYVARPNACPQYASNAKGYWKQIARALKKQKTMCNDATALVKAGMCRKAPKDAHFKLNNNARTKTTNPPPSVAPAGLKSNCPEVDLNKLGEEYCSSSWSSLCTFFFSMVHSDDC